MVNVKYYKVQISNELSWFNHYFIIISKLATMPIESKIRSINVSKKWKTCYNRSESKTPIVLSYCNIFFILSAYTFVNYLMLFMKTQGWTHRYFNRPLISRTSKRPPIDSTTSRRTISYWPKISLLFGKKKSININIASYFLETLASPHENTWYHRGDPSTQIINHSNLIIIVGGLWNIHGKYWLVV